MYLTRRKVYYDFNAFCRFSQSTVSLTLQTCSGLGPLKGSKSSYLCQYDHERSFDESPGYKAGRRQQQQVWLVKAFSSARSPAQYGHNPARGPTWSLLLKHWANLGSADQRDCSILGLFCGTHSTAGQLLGTLEPAVGQLKSATSSEDQSQLLPGQSLGACPWDTCNISCITTGCVILWSLGPAFPCWASQYDRFDCCGSPSTTNCKAAEGVLKSA